VIVDFLEGLGVKCVCPDIAVVIFILSCFAPLLEMRHGTDAETQARHRYSMIAVLPLLGGGLAGLMARRSLNAFFLWALSGYSGYWAGLTYLANSRWDLKYEMNALAFLGFTAPSAIYFSAVYLIKKFTPNRKNRSRQPGPRKQL
jgi:hypothetical protein